MTDTLGPIATPNFQRRRAKLEPITFVSLERAFKAQVRVQATRDISGWASRDRRVKWQIGKGRVGCLDEDVAREFAAKGYVRILDGTVKPVSEGEFEEILSTTTTIQMGASHG
jgi:hypothetical protein